MTGLSISGDTVRVYLSLDKTEYHHHIKVLQVNQVQSAWFDYLSKSTDTSGHILLQKVQVGQSVYFSGSSTEVFAVESI